MEEQETRERGGDGAAIAADARIKQADNNAEATAASVSSSCYAPRGAFRSMQKKQPRSDLHNLPNEHTTNGPFTGQRPRTRHIQRPLTAKCVDRLTQHPADFVGPQERAEVIRQHRSPHRVLVWSSRPETGSNRKIQEWCKLDEQHPTKEGIRGPKSPRRKRINTNRKRSRKNGEKSRLIGGRKQKGVREKFESKNHGEHRWARLGNAPHFYGSEEEQKEKQRDPRSPEEGEGRTNKKGKNHRVNKLETKSTDPASNLMDPTETPGRVRQNMSDNKSIERSSSNIHLGPPTTPKLAMSPTRSKSFCVYTLIT